MLKIHLDEASKRFQYEWIFKNLSLELSQGNSLAITGSNGSGKSTLLKCLSGAIPISSGKIVYIYHEKSLAEAEWFSYLAISAPYMELPEEFSLEEILNFHFKFKKPLDSISSDEIIEQLYLTQHKSKQISQFSSGMKQRLKLGLALFSDVPFILLDEPTSNLDRKGIEWYQEMMQQYGQNRILVICSNEPREYGFCEQKIVLEDYK
ncbi:ABC-type multidrug transport system, ATPase component [Algoriphagus locisalis]|uniref:ABC-type multidrug transport system, ATPase component n=1 Tax=Algoriphagus locisalis TaxID=305507 RepID=A0A1I7DYB2_9BACT|nr:ATP-binding cassette domain-containing protein [Algoriphagus locisalis]SFU16662.1 ABC-type multidrug transport system, ATPase component [Algoriphagus locisalis]